VVFTFQQLEKSRAIKNKRAAQLNILVCQDKQNKVIITKKNSPAGMGTLIPFHSSNKLHFFAAK